MRLPLFKTLFCAALVVFSTMSCFAADRETERLQRRSQKLATVLRNVQGSENSSIPAELLEKAEGLIILKQYEAGVIFGANGGFGLALKRQADGNWGPPTWIRTGEISGGIQLGAQKLYIVLLVMKPGTIDRLAKARFKLGVDATVTKGPTGANYAARLGQDVDVLAYTDFAGYYAGASLEGGVLLPDGRANETSYGEKLDPGSILNQEDLSIPDYLLEIHNLLSKMEAGESIASAEEKAPADDSSSESPSA